MMIKKSGDSLIKLMGLGIPLLMATTSYDYEKNQIDPAIVGISEFFSKLKEPVLMDLCRKMVSNILDSGIEKFQAPRQSLSSDEVCHQNTLENLKKDVMGIHQEEPFPKFHSHCFVKEKGYQIFPNELLLKLDAVPEYGSPWELGLNTNLSSECAPKVLYSWGSASKMSVLSNFFSSGPTSSSTNWKDRYGEPMTLFLSTSPLSSFPYGELSGRFELNPGTRIKYYYGTHPHNDYCTKDLSPDEIDNTVLAVFLTVKDHSLLDFVLCSARPIKKFTSLIHPSGNKSDWNLLYHESLKELSWHLTGKAKPYNTTAYIKPVPGSQDFSLFNQLQIDHIPWTPEALVARLLILRKMVRSN